MLPAPYHTPLICCGIYMKLIFIFSERTHRVYAKQDMENVACTLLEYQLFNQLLAILVFDCRLIWIYGIRVRCYRYAVLAYLLLYAVSFYRTHRIEIDATYSHIHMCCSYAVSFEPSSSVWAVYERHIGFVWRRRLHVGRWNGRKLKMCFHSKSRQI